MSSNSEPELAEYIGDETQQEDRSLFLPAPESNSDPWTRLVLGVMCGLGGAALVTLSPWFAGGLIAVGYGLAALNLKGGANRFGRALCMGFALTALLGATLAAADIAAPLEVRRFVLEAGRRYMIFPTFLALPWALAILRYVYVLLRPAPRKNAGNLAGNDGRTLRTTS
jgi:hypothetical protein